MNEDDKRMFLALVKGKDISEIMSLLAESGNQYSRRILRFFRWFCKWGSNTHNDGAHVRRV